MSYLKPHTLGMLLISLFALMGCSSTESPTQPPTPQLASELRVHIWGDDLPQALYDLFTEQTGVNIVLIPYDSLDDPIKNMRAGEIYDVVVLNNEYVSVAIAENRLAPLDFSLIPNFRNISPNFRDLAYDPQNRHSVPYNWGTFGIVINPEKVTTPITRWADLWELPPEQKMVVWKGQRMALGVALKVLGYSPNTTNLDELAEAEAKLMALRPQVAGFVGMSSDVVQMLTEGDAAVAMGYVGDIFAAQDEGYDLDYILPEEGTLLWGDNFVIPKDSPNIYTAHVFLNFLLDAQNATTILEWNFYSTPNVGVEALISEELRNDVLIFPTNESLEGASLILSLPAEVEARYNEIWQAFVLGEIAP